MTTNTKSHIEFLTTAKSAITDYNKALHVLSNDETLYNLDSETMHAILYLVQKAAKKEVAATKATLDNPFKLASLFMSKKDVRYYLNFIYSDGKDLLASSGHVLIRLNNQNKPEGFYDATGAMIHGPEFAKFPKFDSVYKFVNTDPENAVNTEQGEQSSYSANQGKKTVLVRKLATENGKVEAWFQQEYLSIFKRIGLKTAYLCPMQGSSASSTLYAKTDSFEAIIMPTRM